MGFGCGAARKLPLDVSASQQHIWMTCYVVYTIQLVFDVAESSMWIWITPAACLCISASCPFLPLLPFAPVNTHDAFDLQIHCQFARTQRKYPRLPVDPVRRTTLLPSISARYFSSICRIFSSLCIPSETYWAALTFSIADTSLLAIECRYTK